MTKSVPRISIIITAAGGSDMEGPGGLAFAAGNIYVSGATLSTNFPTTPGALKTVRTGPSEIDDAQSFTAPLVLDQTVAVSQLTTSTLPTQRMWWRARALDGAGNPGAWSGSRRFEVKN